MHSIEKVGMSNPWIRRSRRSPRLVPTSTPAKAAAISRRSEREMRSRSLEERSAGSSEDGFEQGRVQSVTVTPRVSRKKGSPVKGPAPLDAVPLAQLYYQDCYQLEEGPRPKTARTPARKKRRIQHPELEVSRMKEEAMPRVIIPSTSNIIERQASTSRRNQHQIRASLKVRNGRSQRGTSDPYPMDVSYVKRERELCEPVSSEPEIVARSVVDVDMPQEIRNSCIPLHFFDDHSYDDDNEQLNTEFTKIEAGFLVEAECLYCSDREKLAWRSCEVVKRNGPVFTIKWGFASREKEVYRVSLRFPFDDPTRFDERRRKAVMWRERIEREINLFTYLRTAPNGDLAPPTPTMMQNLIARIPNVMVEADGFTELLQEVVEEYYVAGKIDRYCLDCRDRSKMALFKSKGFPPYRIVIPKNGVPSRLTTVLSELPSFLQLYPAHRRMYACRGNRLFTRDGMTDVCDYEAFFDANEQHLENVLNVIRGQDIAFVLRMAEGMVVFWETKDRKNLMKMMDMRVIDVLDHIIRQSLIEFMDMFLGEKIRFSATIGNQLTLDSVKMEDVRDRGRRFLGRICHCFDGVIDSTLTKIGIQSHLILNMDALMILFQDCMSKWDVFIENSFARIEYMLNEIREFTKNVMLQDLESIDDVPGHRGIDDLSVLQEIVQKSETGLVRFRDEYNNLVEMGAIMVDFVPLMDFMTSQHETLRIIFGKFVTSEIAKLTDVVYQQIEDLFDRCQKAPVSVEDWHERHLLLINIDANSETIREGLDSTMMMFDFLEFLYYESDVRVSIVYHLKAGLSKIVKSMPELLKNDEADLNALTEARDKQVDTLFSEVHGFFTQVMRFHRCDDTARKSVYNHDILTLQEKREQLSLAISAQHECDQMLSVEVAQFPLFDKGETDLCIFEAFWEIGEFLDSQVEGWMGMLFLDLRPDDMPETLRRWEERLIDLKTKLENRETFLVEGVEVVKGSHPLIRVWSYFQGRIDYVVSHLPIVQNLCNPVLRNRHWKDISNATGMSIHPNEALTWNWIIESGIEQHISEITNISRCANYEYKIERTLADMMDQLMRISVDVSKNEDRTRIGDVAPIFELLAEHRVRMQDIFIPPYIKRFVGTIKEYDELSANLRRLLTKAVDAQTAIEDLASVMGSRDTRAQNKQMTKNYDDNVEVFNQLADRCSDPSRLHELVANPKYAGIIDELHGKMYTLKGDLERMMEEKKRAFPYFRLLSNTQLMNLISFSHEPSQFKDVFNYLYPGITEAVFADNATCTGFVAVDGEIISFNEPFDVTPEAVEQLFDNFDKAVIHHMSSMIELQMQYSDIKRMVLNSPSQVAVTACQVAFCNKVHKSYESTSREDIEERLGTLLDDIENNIVTLSDITGGQETANALELSSVLIKQRDIVCELTKLQVGSLESREWMKFVRYVATGKKETYEVSVCCGAGSFSYGFHYTRRTPFPFLTSEIEKMYSAFMVNFGDTSCSVVYGDVGSLKTTAILGFSRMVGRNVILYSCASNTKAQPLAMLAETARLTGATLVLRDFQLLPPLSVADIADVFVRGKKKTPLMMFATYTTREDVPLHMRSIFRPVAVARTNSYELLSALLQGIGIIENDKLIQQIDSVVSILAKNIDVRFAPTLSLPNVIRTITEAPLQEEDPGKDVCERLVAQIRVLEKGDKAVDRDICAELGAVFELTECMENLERVIVPPDLRPSSQAVADAMNSFIEMVRAGKDVIVVGDSMTGKSVVINNAAKLMSVNIEVVHPYAQPFCYLSGTKEAGMLHRIMTEENNPRWIVFDGRCADEWMNLLAVSMSNRPAVYFDDGSAVNIPRDTRFVFETDSLVTATPSLLSYCGRVVLPSEGVTCGDLTDRFVEKLAKDERVAELVSRNLLGTSISIRDFTMKVKSFIAKLIPRLCECIDVSDSRQLLANYFSILEALLSAHYYASVRLPMFGHAQMTSMFDNIERWAVFAAIWSCGAVDRRRFNALFRKVLDDLHVSMPEGSVFDFYFDTEVGDWKKWENIALTDVFEGSTPIMEVVPDYIMLDPNALVSSLYLTDCLLSQGSRVALDARDNLLSTLLLRISTNTAFVSSSFDAHIYSTPRNVQAVRQVIEECVGAGGGKNRLNTRLPLLGLTGLDLSFGVNSELLRSMFQEKSLVNLTTFERDKANIGFIGDCACHANSPPDPRVMRHLCVIHVPDDGEDSGRRVLERGLSLLCNLRESEQVAKIVCHGIRSFPGPYKFNMSHVLKLVQRVAMTMYRQTREFFAKSICFESIATFYDFENTEAILDGIDSMVRKICDTMSLEFINTVNMANDYVLTNIGSQVFRAVKSLDDLVVTGKCVDPVSEATGDQKCGKYIENVPGTELEIVKVSAGPSCQRLLLKLGRLLTTPQTHILMRTELCETAADMFSTASDVMHVKSVIFRPGYDIMDVVRDAYVSAGRENVHTAVLVNESTLSRCDMEILKDMIIDINIFGLFRRGQLVEIMTELHANLVEDDPYREESLEAKAEYPILVRNFLCNCRHYFHLCVIASDSSPSFDFYFDHMSPITIVRDMKEVIDQMAYFELPEKCRFTAENAASVLHPLRDIEQFRKAKPIKSLQVLKTVANLFTDLCERHSLAYEAKHELLSNVSDTCRRTEEDLQIALKRQEDMEKDVESLAEQVEALMQLAKQSADDAVSEQKVMEAEEKILWAQELQAEQLRAESETQMAISRPLLEQSTQELNALSVRDISVIRSINHPPRGVFLVVKSIVVIMGRKVEDQTDEASAQQPSWIVGKKLMSDASFLPNLMKRALNNLNGDIINRLMPLVDDPNFQPDVIESSSTAAKSICLFIRGLTRYYDAMKVFEVKQAELRSFESHLAELRRKHDEAVQKIGDINKEIVEKEAKSRSLMVKKQELEQRLEQYRASVEHHRWTMDLMSSFFREWNEELAAIAGKRDTMESRIYLIACYMILCGSFPVNDRDSMFTASNGIFTSLGLPTGIGNRQEFLDDLILHWNITYPGSAYGLAPPMHVAENIGLFRLFPRKWFFVVDQHRTCVPFLRSVTQKKVQVVSYLQADLLVDVADSLMGNNMLVVYDYDHTLMDPLFFRIETSCANRTNVEIAGKQYETPEDYQMIFVVDTFPDMHVFNSLFVDMLLTDDEIANDLSCILLQGLSPDEAHETISAVSSATLGKNEVIKTKSDLQQTLVRGARNLLNDEAVVKQFQTASNIVTRLTLNMAKLQETSKKMTSVFLDVKENVNVFVDLYRQFGDSRGLAWFREIVQTALTDVPMGETISARIEVIYKAVRSLMADQIAISQPLEARIPELCRFANVDITDLENTITTLSTSCGFDTNVTARPISVQDIIDSGNNRMPILVHCSNAFLRYISRSDKARVGSMTGILTDYQAALRDGKTLVVFLPSEDLFPHVLSVASKMRSAVSLSQDFRFFVFTDVPPRNLCLPSKFPFAFADLSWTLNIRRRAQFSVSSIQPSLFDNNLSGQTDRWRRIVLLLTLFDSAVNLMSTAVFNAPSFSDDNFEIAVDLARRCDTSDLATLGETIANCLYSSDHPSLTHHIIRVWNQIFDATNLESGPVNVFDAYEFPRILTPSAALEVVSAFPFVDDPSTIAFPGNSFNAYRTFTTGRWRKSADPPLLGRLDVTPSVMQRPIDLSVFSDVSNLLALVHRELRAVPTASRQIVISNRPSGVSVENLILVNLEQSGGSFRPCDGFRRADHMYVVLCERSMSTVPVPLYRRGVLLCYVYADITGMMKESSFFETPFVCQ